MINAALSISAAKLGQLVNITTGKLDANAASENGQYPFFTCAELPLKIDNYEFDEDAILLAGNGSFGVSQYNGKFNAYQRTYVITPRIGPTRYYYWLIKAKIPEITASNRGSTVKYIRKGDIEDVIIPLPPLAEQTRIAQKLDELLAQVDTLKARIDAIPALLKRFRQSVLAAAVSGRLTEEWRVLNPSMSLISADELKNAWADIYRLQGKKYKEADLLPGELGYPLPASWVEAKVGEVFDVYVGATPSRENTDFWGGTIPWVSSSEVAFCHIKETRESITEVGYKSASTTIHPAGTVMLAMIGQGKTRGQPAILDIDACHNQNTAAIRVHPNYCISEFLYYYLYERYEETRRVGSGNNQQALNKKAVQSLPFPLPPLAEQTEIVRRVEQLFAFADQLEAKIASAKTRIDHLTQSILAKAFRGELVPQDPNDEPASKLLARIQAQRAAAPKAKRGRKASA
jgi:type I restriction enzyme S subunit